MTGGLAEVLRERTVILDGGLATHLAAAGHDLSDHLWSARLLADEPEAIVSAHLAYLRAGAEVITTASYQATVEGFARRGIGATDATTLLRRSVALAKGAREQAWADGLTGPRWVAASVGPYGAMLADGSEYRGRYGLSVAELIRFHRPRMRMLADAGPDVLALETVPDAREAEALVSALDGLGVPAWLCYTVAGLQTRAGQPLAEAFGVTAGVDGLIAIGVNCCAPADVAAALRVACAVTGKPGVAYPNSGERWDARKRRWAGLATLDDALTPDWVRAGARLVGGCCRVGPTQVAAMARRLGHA